MTLGAVVLSSREAGAASGSEWCKLDRSPVLLPMDEALPDAVKCASDEDYDGLDDVIEEQLARCFVPTFQFDPHENALEASDTFKADAKVVEAVTDGHTAWVLTKTTLERWRLTPNGSAERIALGALPVRGRALAVSGAQVPIGTDVGVHAVRATNTSLQISQPAGLCGRPLRAASVSGSLWAVATTLGVAMVSTGAEGAPVVLSVSGVIPDPGGAGWLVPLPEQTPGLTTCRHLDHAFGEPLMEAMSRTSALAATDRRVLAARGPFVVELDVTEAQAPVLVQSEAVHTSSLFSTRCLATARPGPNAWKS